MDGSSDSPSTTAGEASPTPYASSSGHGRRSGPNWSARASMIGTISTMPAKSPRSEEHTSELQSLMRSSYAVFCLKKKKTTTIKKTIKNYTQHDNNKTLQ